MTSKIYKAVWTAAVLGVLAVFVAAASSITADGGLIILPDGILNFKTGQEAGMVYNSTTGLNSKMLWDLKSDGGVFAELYADDGNRFSMIVQNDTDSVLPNKAYFYTSGVDYIGWIEGDTNDFPYAAVVSDVPYIGVVGGTDLYFRQYDDSAWVTVHADAFTEHTNPYNGSVLEAYLDLADWLDLKHPERLSRKIPQYEERVNPITGETYDGDYIGEEVTGTDLGKSGKANALINIRQKQEIEELKNRLDEIEQSLCNQGASKYC